VTETQIRALVIYRAGGRCEYCHIRNAELPHLHFHIEHVIVKQHLGGDEPENLALACDRCNFYKGTNLSAVDPVSREVVSLYNPRIQSWEDHFELVEHQVVGLAEIGRATSRLLNMNAENRVQLRRDAESAEN